MLFVIGLEMAVSRLGIVLPLWGNV
jgi:hypothetical protein